MNLKEQLAEKKAALLALEPELKAEDVKDETIAQGEELVKAIAELEASIEKAEKAQDILNNIGTKAEKEDEDMEDMKKIDLSDLKTTKGTRSFAYKANDDLQTSVTVGVTDTRVVDAQPPLGVRDIIGSESINGNSLTYFVMGAFDGSFATVAEGGEKPQVHANYAPVTKALIKKAGFLKESDELLSDNAFLDSAIRSRGIYEFRKEVESYIVSELAKTSGVQAGEATISFDNILKAKQAIRTETGYAADAIIINPADLEALLISKDKNDQYLLGGPAYGAYGNGTYSSNPKVWGLTVVESSEIPEGQAIVGAFKVGTSLVTKAGEGLRVEVSNSNEDDFIKNCVTVRIEERMVLATRVPAAFVLVGTASSSS